MGRPATPPLPRLDLRKRAQVRNIANLAKSRERPGEGIGLSGRCVLLREASAPGRIVVICPDTSQIS